MNLLANLQQKLDYQFQNISLLQNALIHRSFLNENRSLVQSNERLEFLGDAVLELVSSEFLFQQYPDLPEGQLTNLRAKIVQTKTLALVANNLELGSHLKMSRGEEATGGRTNTSILADTVEAIIGSIYLDGGFNKVQEFIKLHLLKNYEDILTKVNVEDYKSTLQEKIQAQGGNAPTYHVLEATGPDHDKTFKIQVNYLDKAQEIGQGKSKQSAQQEAAKKALENLAKLK